MAVVERSDDHGVAEAPRRLHRLLVVLAVVALSTGARTLHRQKEETGIEGPSRHCSRRDQEVDLYGEGFASSLLPFAGVEGEEILPPEIHERVQFVFVLQEAKQFDLYLRLSAYRFSDFARFVPVVAKLDDGWSERPIALPQVVCRRNTDIS